MKERGQLAYELERPMAKHLWPTTPPRKIQTIFSITQDRRPFNLWYV